MQRLTTRRLYGIGVVLFVSALPLKVGGCGNSACFTITNAQLINGQCPSLQMAQQRFSGNGCDTSGLTVTGNGELDGTLCCYPVDQHSVGAIDCINGFGGAGGVFSGGGAGGVFSGGPGGAFPDGAGGAFPAGGMVSVGAGPCGSCAEVLNGVATATVLCGPNGSNAFMALEACACSSPCASICQTNFCAAQNPTFQCRDCLDNASSGCAGPLMACLAN